MSDIAIKVENLSKLYQLGQIGTGTLSRDLERWWANIRGKEDPFAKVGQVNDRTKKTESDFVWALKDINFEVKQGEVLGIIGRNGAGKSTLLKILSKITAPSSGKIYVNGRIASLLEVGTGFHPEMNGRENIYLNGAIMGLRKWEIDKKLDEIIDFAGVERYIDTPVKRYSSGMYVRLAFAVAAYLEPDILIVDEVLAVGDAEFQKKCLGKMKDVSLKGGRTVIFVSHNIAALKQLCTQGLLLKNGLFQYEGNMVDVTEKYLTSSTIATARESKWEGRDAPGNEKIVIRAVSSYSIGKTPADSIRSNEDIVIELEFENLINDVFLDVTWDMFDAETVHVFHIGTLMNEGKEIIAGRYNVKFTIPKNLLNCNRYYFNVIFGVDQSYLAFQYKDILNIDVEDSLANDKRTSFHKLPGIIHPKLDWDIKKNNS